MRRLCATILVAEAIIMGLAIPVAVQVAHADLAEAAFAGGAMAVSCLVLAGLLRYRWAYAVGGVLQAAVIASGFVVPTMFILGAIFGALWIAAIWLGRKVENAESR